MEGKLIGMKTFSVNDFITLKLEDGKTVIYVVNEPFLTCTSLLVDIPIQKISSFDEIKSVDEAVEHIDIRKSVFEYHIPPETEFWGHCSNMQVWAEHNYDTRLLHSSLAFPLLAKLFRVGDPTAKSVFKEEIAKRLGSGCQSVVNFLYEEDFVYTFLSDEEVFHSLLVPEEAEVMIELESLLNTSLVQRWKFSEPDTFIVKDRHVCSINLGDSELEDIPEILFNLKRLERLELYRNKFSYLPESIVNLKCLSYLDLSNNKFTSFPPQLKGIKTLEYVNLSGNELFSLKEEDLSVFKNTFIELFVSREKLYRIFKRIIDILKQLKTIKFEYLAEMLFLERDTLNKILHYHQKEMISAGLRISRKNGYLSLRE